MPAKVMPCDCRSAMQDKLYGKGQRVWNETTKPPGWRCSVCGAKK